MREIGEKSDKDIGVSDGSFLVGELRDSVHIFLNILRAEKLHGLVLNTRNDRKLYINNLGLGARHSRVPAHKTPCKRT